MHLVQHPASPASQSQANQQDSQNQADQQVAKLPTQQPVSPQLSKGAGGRGEALRQSYE